MLVDLRHLMRNLRRSPASAAAAVLTLSLTLGAGASIFAVVDAVLLTPPPFTDPDALVTVGETSDRRARGSAAGGELCHLRGLARACGIAGSDRSLRHDKPDADGTRCGGASERDRRHAGIPGAPWRRPVAWSHVRSRRCRPASRDRQPRVLARKLAADPGVIGRQVVLGGQAHTIVGVLPEQFFFALNPSRCVAALAVIPARPGGARRLPGARRGSSRPQRLSADLEAALDDVSRRSSPPARPSRRAYDGSDRRRRDENAWPARGCGGARHAHRLHESCGAADRAIDRSPPGAGGEGGARRAPVRDRAASWCWRRRRSSPWESSAVCFSRCG